MVSRCKPVMQRACAAPVQLAAASSSQQKTKIKRVRFFQFLAPYNSPSCNLFLSAELFASSEDNPSGDCSSPAITAKIAGLYNDSEPPRKTMRRGVLMTLLQQSAMTLPLWIGKPGDKPPPLCGAIPASGDYVAKPGDKVAARVKAVDGDEQWILAEVVSYSHATNKYEVDDIDEEGKERHTLSRRRIIPLPQWKANPETDPEALFQKEQLVLALYPQTTCFYRALIHTPPQRPQDDYSVLFEDTSYTDGYSPPLNVAQRYVVACKEPKKK
ncbi:hypothetical protein U0070_006136 [Myodes glareolus]|uniref:SAGA-associated factor 29 n=1 Tax=Myodes glareolus TaxID=447135 RepID=A0AAW0H9U6_MYOGA